MSWLIDLLQNGILVQGILTLVIWAAIIYLAVTGQTIPEILMTGGVAILAYFFGERTARARVVKDKCC